MEHDREEPNRVFGFPVRGARSQPGDRPSEPEPGPALKGRQGQESQRVLGFSADWLRPDGRSVFARLTDRARGYWRRTSHRQYP